MRIFILVVYARVVKVRDIAFPFYHQGILFRNPIQRHTSTSGIQISKYKRENKESNSYYAFEALCQVFIKEEKWLEKTRVFLYRVTQTMMSKLLLCLRRGVERCMGWGLREAPVAPVFVMKEQLRQELPPAATFQHFYLPGKWIFYMHRRRSRTSGPTNVFKFHYFYFYLSSLLLSKWIFYMHRRRSWTSGPTKVFKISSL